MISFFFIKVVVFKVIELLSWQQDAMTQGQRLGGYITVLHQGIDNLYQKQNVAEHQQRTHLDWAQQQFVLKDKTIRALHDAGTQLVPQSE